MTEEKMSMKIEQTEYSEREIKEIRYTLKGRIFYDEL